MSDANELAEKLEARAFKLDDDREFAKDCSRVGECWDPMTAQGVANTMHDAVEALHEAASTLRANAERIKALEEALETAVRVADEAQREWDAAPEGMRAGKLLIALADPSLMYRAEITAMHAARAARSNAT